MKKRRFLRKLLRPRMLIIYILVILIAVLILTYAFGGVKAKTDNLTDNISFNFDYDGDNASSNWKSMLNNTSFENQKWIAQNDKYVLYFDEETTILTLYVIEDAAKTGNKVSYTSCDGTTAQYDEIDPALCTVSYSTAKTGDTNNSNINLRVADSSTGKLYGNGYTSFSNSVQYYNKFI